MEAILISQLSEFGFTQNEAKAYLTLLQHHPATGYEVSQYSGVPRSAIYDILRKLELGGIVYPEGEKPVYYNPIPPDQLTNKLASRFEHNIHELREGLNDVNTALTRETTWNIKGYKAMIDQARSLIDNAEKSIFMSMWAKEYSELKVQISRAKKRKLDISCFSFTRLPEGNGNIFSYNIDEDKLRDIWHRQIVLVIDKTIAILGGADKTLENQCICTDNPAIVDTCLNYLILDFTLFSHRKNVDVQQEIEKMMSVKTDKLNSLLK